jgi:hypothetical protein
VATRIQLRRGIASSWTSSNPILASGEVGIETDTNKIKIGDGSSNWTELDYFADVYAASASIISYINSEIGDLIDSAPALLDTLNELAAAIGDDPSFFSNIATTINSASATAYASASAYTNAQINALTTSDIEEGSRLYFTNQRALDATAGATSSASAYALSQANSYSNSASAAAYASASANTLSQINALTTTDIEEGTNKYFTNQRAIDAASATYILQTSQQSIINTASAAAVTAVLDGAPGALDTLNELAAALGDNPDILSTFITSNTASSIYLTQAAYASASPNFATDAELASAIVTASAAAVVYADALTTADIAENTNLYFTNERAVNAGSATYILQSSQQGIINSASATAYASASAYTNSEINALTTNDIPEPTVAGNETFTVTNSGTGAYVVAAVNNPTFNLVKGNTYTFVINASGHPFWIQSASGAYSSGNIYSTGTTNLGTDNGTITWTIPLNAPNTLYYACQFHSSMQGTINLVDPGNLYFTHERAINAASVTFIPLSSQQSIINSASAAAVTAVLDGAPGALDTLNELAAALNDDSSFATTVTNSLAAKLDASSASATYLTQSNASASYVAQNSTGNEYIQDQASSLFVHSNHTNVTATYDDANNQVILVGSAGGGGSASGGGASIIVSASAPVGAVEGDAWFDNTDGSFYVYDGTFWVETAPEGSGSTDGGSFTRWSKTYSGSATLISGTDDDLFSLNYYPGLEQVFINGILQDISNYTATSGSTIVLNEAVVNNDVVEVIAVQSFNFADAYTKAEIDQKVSNYTRWTKTMGASATTISGLDDSSLTLSYTVGNEEIFVNGILLTRTTDYTATSGSTVLLVEAVSSGDIVEIKSHEILNVGNLYTQTQADARYEIKRNTYIVNGAYTASINDIIFVNTSASAHTITLPATPVLGHKVLISDLSNNANINNITVGRNSEKIDGAEDNFTIDVNNGSVEFIYTNTTYGWRTI